LKLKELINESIKTITIIIVITIIVTGEIG